MAATIIIKLIIARTTAVMATGVISARKKVKVNIKFHTVQSAILIFTVNNNRFSHINTKKNKT